MLKLFKSIFFLSESFFFSLHATPSEVNRNSRFNIAPVKRITHTRYHVGLCTQTITIPRFLIIDSTRYYRVIIIYTWFLWGKRFFIFIFYHILHARIIILGVREYDVSCTAQMNIWWQFSTDIFVIISNEKHASWVILSDILEYTLDAYWNNNNGNRSKPFSCSFHVRYKNKNRKFWYHLIVGNCTIESDDCLCVCIAMAGDIFLWNFF